MKEGERMNAAYSFLSSQTGQDNRIFYDGTLNAKSQGWKYEFYTFKIVLKSRSETYIM